MSDYGLAAYGAVLPVIPASILGPNGQQYADTPAVLNEADRDQSAMLGWDAYLLRVYSYSRFNPDALVNHLGWDEIDKMLTMSAYTSPLRMLKYATLYKRWTLTQAVRSVRYEQRDGFQKGDYDRSMRIMDMCHYVLSDIVNPVTDQSYNFRTFLWYLLDALHYGFSVQEINWRILDRGPFKGKWGLQSFTYRRPKQIGFNLHPSTLAVQSLRSWTPLITDQHPLGDTVPLEKVVLYTYDPVNALPYGKGVSRDCYKHFISIDAGLRDWAIQEKRGAGFLRGTSRNPNMMGRLLATLQAWENGAPLVHTDMEVIDYVAGAGSSGLSYIESFVAYHSMAIKEAILGQALTTTMGDRGSYAQSAIHQNTQNFFLTYPRHDAEDVATDQVLRRIVRYNAGRDAEYLTPRLFLGHWDNAERMALAQFHQVYLNTGVIRNGEEWIRKEAGMDALDTTHQDNLDLPLPELPDRTRINIDATPPQSKSGTGTGGRLESVITGS